METARSEIAPGIGELKLGSGTEIESDFAQLFFVAITVSAMHLCRR